MKIKKIHTRDAIINLGFSSSFDIAKGFEIVYSPEQRGYMVNNKVLVPESNITEVLFEDKPVSKPKAKKEAV